jgi:hypothetical protein
MGVRLALVPLLAASGWAAGLSNGQVSAEFGDRGLASLHDEASRATYHFNSEDFRISIGGQTYSSASLAAPERKSTESAVEYAYAAGPYKLAVIYELRPEWRFVSKQIVITDGPKGRFKLDEIAVFTGSLAEPVKEAHLIARANPRLGTRDYGAFLRFERSRGLLVTAQNPFLEFDRDGAHLSLSYKPAMEWDLAWGPFEADRGLLAPYSLTGETQPEKMLPEWQLGPDESGDGLDDAEVATYTDLVQAFLLYRPAHPLNLMVGWCANDYQIDIATPEGRAEYKRILDTAADVGAEHVLFAPANSAVSKRPESTDDWKWEYVTWLGLGEKIRRNEWDPATGAIPDDVREMLDYARSKRLGLLAYVYPVLGFQQNPAWLVAGGTRANLGIRAFQDWLIGALEGFYRHTGITGYSFDHTFLNLDGASRYAQWYGWRRVLESLRRDLPEIVIDGRQAYQNYGPWTWLAGSYPHPTSTDEQPESFVSFPDLHIDRVSADRERYTAWRYRNYEFAPSEIVPGFITHQTPRNDDSGHMPEQDGVLTPFRRRDWDYLGWKYSLLSSIAIAGWNNVIDMLPARDMEEFRSFSAADRDFFRHWIDWADVHKEYLRHTLPILGAPAIGKVDGTAAFLDDGGYLFLFNPNGRRAEATLVLDSSIGLTQEGRYVVRELYPRQEMLVGRPDAALYTYGDPLTRDLDGGSAMVLEVERAVRDEEPQLFNSPGSARIEDGVVRLKDLRGEAGTTEVVQVLVPSGPKITAVDVDGAVTSVKPNRFGVVEVPVSFAGARFRHYEQVDSYRKDFTGGTVTATFSVPQRVFDQLAARRKAWPIPWTDEDRRSTWLDPARLLLFVQIAEPDDRWEASLKIDGQAVPLLKGYASVRANRRNFTGFYADVSGIAPEKAHRLELELPKGLKPGQYQGVFFENVETEYTAPVGSHLP